MVKLADKVEYVDAAGRVKRYHTEDIECQGVGAHSWGVAQICRAIYPGLSKELLCAALDHDLAEKRTGDTPYPTKVEFPIVREALAAAEDEIHEQYEINTVLRRYENNILKAADGLELMFYCLHQMRMGNRNAEGPYLRIQDSIRKNRDELDKGLLSEPAGNIDVLLRHLENQYVSL